jgi:hypothetical protein
MVRGEPLNRLTVSDVWTINASLARKIGRWPNYRRVIVQKAEDGYFAPGSIELTPLTGSIQLSGNEHFQVD